MGNRPLPGSRLMNSDRSVRLTVAGGAYIPHCKNGYHLVPSPTSWNLRWRQSRVSQEEERESSRGRMTREEQCRLRQVSNRAKSPLEAWCWV